MKHIKNGLFSTILNIYGGFFFPIHKILHDLKDDDFLMFFCYVLNSTFKVMLTFNGKYKNKIFLSYRNINMFSSNVVKCLKRS